jgi:hypothetical protein
MNHCPAVFPIARLDRGFSLTNSRVWIGVRLSLTLILVISTSAGAVVPTKVRAVPGNHIVSLVWARGAQSSTYRIYRSTTTGNTGATPLVNNYSASPAPKWANWTVGRAPAWALWASPMRRRSFRTLRLR